MRAFDRWRALRWHERALTLEAAALTVVATISIRVQGAPRLLGPPDVPRRRRPIDDAGVRAAVAAVDRTSRYLAMSCLPRALALRWMLARRGVATTLRLGARREGDALLAHAWVEWNGVVLSDPEIVDRYAPLT
ncbi:MAG TPA: lasso peptide biosynthesis B2 protein [Vicinamibacterales bacterium]|jgi:hypothetical protein